MKAMPPMRARAGRRKSHTGSKKKTCKSFGMCFAIEGYIEIVMHQLDWVTYHDHKGPECPVDGDEQAGNDESESEESSNESHIIYL